MELVPNMENRLVWVHDNKGEFTVKKLTGLLIEGEGDDFNLAFYKIWKLKLPPKVPNFIWLLANDKIPTKEFLVKRGVQLHNTLCPWCEKELEQVVHLFFKCNFIEGF